MTTPISEIADGLTLRDWLAGQALIACGKPYGGRSDDSHKRRDYLLREHAKLLYAVADAMLHARKGDSNP